MDLTERKVLNMSENNELKEFLDTIPSEEVAVTEYDLGPDAGINDHDQMAISQANKLLQIGYLEYETEVYGSAYYKDGEINYYISAKDETMDKFLRNCYQQNIYPAPAKYFSKRYDLVNDTEEDIKTRFRLSVAYQLKAAYPPVFFEAVNALTAPDSKNGAFALMNELCGQLDSCFDMHQLNLFGDLVEMLFRGRLLTKESYILLNQWLTREYEKISVEPIASGDYRRTYAGFAYQKPDGTIKYFIDAFPYMAMEKQVMFMTKGYIVTPILTITYYADSFNNLMNSRELFKVELEKYVGEMYINLMKLFRQLPSGVDNDLYLSYQEKIKETGSKAAQEAFLYYGYLWNVKF